MWRLKSVTMGSERSLHVERVEETVGAGKIARKSTRLRGGWPQHVRPARRSPPTRKGHERAPQTARHVVCENRKTPGE